MPPAPTDQVSVSQALELVDSGAILLDIREQYEWDDGHAPQARLLPMSELAGRASELPTDVPLICVCHVGARSAAVAAALNRAGWQAVNLTGGMLAWQAAGLPIIDHAGAPGHVD